MNIFLRMNGITFIESLVALCLISITLLGIEKMLLVAIQMNQQAWFQTLAGIQINNMIALMELRRANWRTFVSAWQNQNKILLPRGLGKIDLFQNQYSVSVIWHSPIFSIWKCHLSSVYHVSCLERIKP